MKKAIHQRKTNDPVVASESDDRKGSSIHLRKKPVPKHAFDLPSKKVTALLCVIMVIFASGIGYGFFSLYAIEENAVNALEVQESMRFDFIPSDIDEIVVENPIDFQALKEQNPDIYAWIDIPDLDISFPILQNLSDEDFYLKHNVNGEYDIFGAIYSQPVNSIDFTDPVTVLYGHTFPKYGVMFTKLHELEDASVFGSLGEFKIYTPTKILSYEMVAACESDNHHIMDSLDIDDVDSIQDHFNSVLAPVYDNSHVKEGTVLEAAKDRIVHLSTCTIPSDANKRYIVTGRLVSTQYTF